MKDQNKKTSGEDTAAKKAEDPAKALLKRAREQHEQDAAALKKREEANQKAHAARVKKAKAQS